MRKLALPAVDDALALASLGKKGFHIRAVADARAGLEARYAEYTEHCGDPWAVEKVQDFDDLKQSIHSLYKAPPAALGFIGDLRNGMRGACPVCGRDALGTLDHYLPKEEYCEFSVYSKNLVPACDRCNNTRGDLVKGTVKGERPAHPYFDNFLSKRVMMIEAIAPWETPLMRATTVNVRGEEARIVHWHIKNIIEPAGLIPYVVDLWGKLVRNPKVYIFGEVNDADDVCKRLTQLAEIEAVSGESPNAWKACFYYGISQSPGAADYLWQQMQI